MKSLWKLALGLPLSCGIVATAHAQTGLMDRFVLDGKEAIAVLPAELIAAPTVKKIYISPNGTSLVVLREKIAITPDILPDESGKPKKRPEGEQELIYWNVRSRTPRSFWKGDLTTDVEFIVWQTQTENVWIGLRSYPEFMTDTKKVFSAADVESLPAHCSRQALEWSAKWTLLKMAEGQTRATEINLPDPGISGGIDLAISAISSLMLVKVFFGHPKRDNDGNSLQNHFFYLINRDGRLNPLVLPFAYNEHFVVFGMDENGSPFIGWTDEDNNPISYTLNPSTLVFTQTGGKWEHQKFPNRNPDRKRIGTLLLKSEGGAAVPEEQVLESPAPLWLQTIERETMQRVLLSAEATEGSLINRGNGAAYKSQGALWYVPFLRVNQAQFMASRRAALKAQALYDARHAGTGLMRVASANNGVLLAPDEVQRVLKFYILKSIFDKLVYTYPGGRIYDLPERSQTLLGYIAAPGGRANIYADGEVKWQDDLKK